MSQVRALRLQGKVAIVTGGGGGIGRATSCVLAQEGSKVIVSDVNEEAAAQTVELIRKAGGEAISVTRDITKPEEVQDLVDTAMKTFGGVDILFNNAGVSNAEVKLPDITIDEWDRVVDINLKGVFLGMKYAIPKMEERGGG